MTSFDPRGETIWSGTPAIGNGLIVTMTNFISTVGRLKTSQNYHPICASWRQSYEWSTIRSIYRLAVLARYRLYGSAVYAIARPSVRPSVRHTGGSVKTVEVRIMKYALYDSPIPLVFARQVSSKNSKGFPGRVRQTREGWGNKPFSSFKRQYLENGRRYGQRYY